MRSSSCWTSPRRCSVTRCEQGLTISVARTRLAKDPEGERGRATPRDEVGGPFEIEVCAARQHKAVGTGTAGPLEFLEAAEDEVDDLVLAELFEPCGRR